MSEKTYRVVVVEDENLIAKNIAKHIEAENPAFKVIGIYSNGEDALIAIREKLPDVVFTDISMPVMTGLDLAKELHETLPNIRCVILTGYADFDYAKEALHYEVVDYLLKPLNTEELRKVLKNIELSIPGITGSVKDASEKNLSPEEIVILVKEYIHKNYAGDLDLNTISQDLGFSSSYLTKVFNKIEQTTPSKYIRNYRMNIAGQLLNNKDMTIAQIAEAVGYNDPFHFSKSFKQTFGISPTDYQSQ